MSSNMYECGTVVLRFAMPCRGGSTYAAPAIAHPVAHPTDTHTPRVPHSLLRWPPHVPNRRIASAITLRTSSVAGQRTSFRLHSLAHAADGLTPGARQPFDRKYLLNTLLWSDKQWFPTAQIYASRSHHFARGGFGPRTNFDLHFEPAKHALHSIPTAIGLVVRLKNRLEFRVIAQLCAIADG